MFKFEKKKSRLAEMKDWFLGTAARRSKKRKEHLEELDFEYKKLEEKYRKENKIPKNLHVKYEPRKKHFLINTIKK